MAPIIQITDVSKEFKVLNRREGLKGSLKDLFSRDYKTVRAVDHVSMSIEQGEIVGYLGPNGAGKAKNWPPPPRRALAPKSLGRFFACRPHSIYDIQLRRAL